MPISTDGILFDVLTSDPGSPTEGQIWYNTTDKLFRVYRNSAVAALTDSVAFGAHTGSTSNPHSTTLEQARSAGNTLSGSINMNGNSITGIAAGSSGTDAAQRQWVVDQITARLQGLQWQAPVINSQTTPPVPTPTEGDRYRITATATGVWAGKENQIATWTSGDWSYVTPTEGYVLRDMTANTYIVYDGTAWGNFGNAVDHNSLLNLTTGNPHTQYQQTSQKGQINGYASLDGSATIGDSQHGSRSGGSLHSLTSSSAHGFMPQTNRAATANPTVNDDGTAGYVVGSLWYNTNNGTVWTALSVGTGAAVWKELTNSATILKQKSGKVLAASFAGNPKKATVTFTTAFADANYAVVLTPVISASGASYVPQIESQLAGSFVINMGANGIGSLIQVNWIAIYNGESA